MTKTEEKIQDMLNNPLVSGNDNYRTIVTWAAKEMAKWKDEQFKEYLEKKIHTIESMEEPLPTDTAVVRIIKEIINGYGQNC